MLGTILIMDILYGNLYLFIKGGIICLNSAHSNVIPMDLLDSL